MYVLISWWCYRQDRPHVGAELCCLASPRRIEPWRAASCSHDEASRCLPLLSSRGAGRWTDCYATLPLQCNNLSLGVPVWLDWIGLAWLSPQDNSSIKAIHDWHGKASLQPQTQKLELDDHNRTRADETWRCISWRTGRRISSDVICACIMSRSWLRGYNYKISGPNQQLGRQILHNSWDSGLQLLFCNRHHQQFWPCVFQGWRAWKPSITSCTRSKEFC